MTETAYLSLLGDRVRAWRNEQGVTRKALSVASGVSERYLARARGGRRQHLGAAAAQGGAGDGRFGREPGARGSAARSASPSSACAARASRRSERSSARRSRLPFVELDREVEKEAGAELGEVFAMYGQEGFRRFERRALERVLAQHDRAVIATGGSLVTDAGTYNCCSSAACASGSRLRRKSIWRA